MADGLACYQKLFVLVCSIENWHVVVYFHLFLRANTPCGVQRCCLSFWALRGASGVRICALLVVMQAVAEVG